MKIHRLVIATSNLGKLGELRALLPFELIGVDKGVLPEETGTTYVQNATLKAVAAMNATGLPSLGDDSGIEVRAIGDRPGLYSARFCETRLPGEPQDAANRRQLLQELRASGVPEDRWDAKFVCALVLAIPGEPVRVYEGEAHGRVIPHERGTNGFGYDPLLLIPSLQKTFAELDDASKNALSHRGKAVRKLLDGISEPG